MRKAAYTVLAGALALVLLGCAKSGDKDPTDRPISDAELVAMVLSLQDLGSQYEGYELDEDAGFHDAEDRIDDATDKDDERADLERFGFVKAYGEAYTDFAFILSGSSEKAIGAGTDVSLYEDADGADGDFDDQIKDNERDVGVADDEGNVLTDYETFDVPGIGHESIGFRGKITSEGSETSELAFYVTYAAVRRGRIIGDAAIIRLDDRRIEDDVIALAETLDERIVAVLNGEMEGRGTPTPLPTEPAGALVAPADALDSFAFSSDVNIETQASFTFHAEGAYVAPDRVTCTQGGSFGPFGSDETVTAIGDSAWTDDGSGPVRTTADDPDVEDSLSNCPYSDGFWRDFDLEPAGVLPGVLEEINGVAARRYSFAAALEALAGLGLTPAGLEGVTISAFDLWIAEDGRWPVALAMDVSGDSAAIGAFFDADELSGAEGPVSFSFRVDITRPNDPTIVVEPPAP